MPRCRLALLASIAAAVMTVEASAQTTSTIAVVPLPTKLTAGTGTFTITASTPIVADTGLLAQARQLARVLTPATGFDLDVSTGAAPKVFHIAFSLQKALATVLGRGVSARRHAERRRHPRLRDDHVRAEHRRDVPGHALDGAFAKERGRRRRLIGWDEIFEGGLAENDGRTSSGCRSSTSTSVRSTRDRGRCHPDPLHLAGGAAMRPRGTD